MEKYLDGSFVQKQKLRKMSSRKKSRGLKGIATTKKRSIRARTSFWALTHMFIKSPTFQGGPSSFETSYSHLYQYSLLKKQMHILIFLSCMIYNINIKNIFDIILTIICFIFCCFFNFDQNPLRVGEWS